MDNNDDFDLGEDLQNPYGLDNGDSYVAEDAKYLGGGEDMAELGDLGPDGLGPDGQLDDDLPEHHFEDIKANGNILDPNKSEAGKMFIGGLNWETTDESMRTYFEKFGEVEDCVVMKDPATSRSRGFGFLTFKDPKSVEEVVQLEHTLDGKIIDPKRAIPREEQEKTEKIFVGGVGPDVSEDQFREYFMQFGKVIDATLMIDRETGRPRGFGFITFENSDGVDKAMAKQFMGELAINDKTVEVKRAMPKHKVPQAGVIPQPRFGRPDGFPGGMDARASGFGPIRSRVGFGGGDPLHMSMAMSRMPASRYGYPTGAAAAAMSYARYGGGGTEGGPGGAYGGAAGAGYGYPAMYGRYGGYGGMEGYPYGRSPAAMAAYYAARGYGGGSGMPYGYGYPASYGAYGAGAAGGAGGDMYRYGGSGGSGIAGLGYAREEPGGGYGQELSPGEEGRGSPERGSRGTGNGGGRAYSPDDRRDDEEGGPVALAGGEVDVKPIITPSGPRFQRDRDRDYGSGYPTGGSGGYGRSGGGSRSHGYHPYAR
ncbi:hypothetical protein HDU86_006864 [Geranomyces michiganensis]|nr:hypothetical protein HDU86_006864 [Geranomyces michiganensis]